MRSFFMKRKEAAAKRLSFIEAIRGGERGAFDLISIIVGVIIAGLLAGAALFTAFSVVPWVQNNVATSSVSAVHDAQTTYYGMHLNDPVAANRGYATEAQLVAAELIQDDLRLVIINEVPSSSGYTVVFRAETGKFFVSESSAPRTVTEYADLAALNAASLGTFTWDGVAGLTVTP